MITWKDNQKSGIYLILLNGKKYVGSAVNLYVRMHNHIHSLKNNSHRNRYIQRLYNKYGEPTFQVLEYCDKLLLIEREQFFIDTLKPEINICKIAGSSLGVKHTEETKKKFSEIRKGQQTKGMLGKKHRPDTIEKIRALAKVRGIPESLRLASIKANTGSKHTKEHRDKVARMQSKISPNDAVQIIDYIQQGLKQTDIAKIYGVSQRVICRVHLGIGIYGDKDYFEAQEKRFAKYLSQGVLFE